MSTFFPGINMTFSLNSIDHYFVLLKEDEASPSPMTEEDVRA